MASIRDIPLRITKKGKGKGVWIPIEGIYFYPDGADAGEVGGRGYIVFEGDPDNPIPFEDVIALNESMNGILRRAQRFYAQHIRKTVPTTN
jgi:hypothetical protein